LTRLAGRLVAPSIDTMDDKVSGTMSGSLSGTSKVTLN